MERHAQAFYANLRDVVSWEFTLSHGVFPSTGQLVVTPHTDVLPERGTFVIAENNQVRVHLRDCATERANLVTEGGHLWSILFVDRRWKWRFGQIDGLFNLPIAKDRYERQKRPRELIQLCLDAIGERGVDLGAVPNDVFPFVEWHGTPPNEALGALLEELGLRIVLRPDDTVAIVRVHSGALLPRLGLEKSVQLQASRGAVPDALRALCSPPRYQVTFDLEAVGEDVDGRILPIDELSYRPPDGWGSIVEPDFSAVQGTYQPPFLPRPVKPTPLADLAKRSVFRMYRIRRAQNGNGFFGPPGFDGPPVNTRFQILPLINEVNENYKDSDGIERPKPAVVDGVWHPGRYANKNTAAGTLYEESWRLDGEHGLVVFSDYVYRYTDDALTKLPATLSLTCTCEVQDLITGVPKHHEVDMPIAKGGQTQPMLVNMPELKPTVTGDKKNFDAIRKKAIEKLQKVRLSLGGSVGGSVVYAGIHAIPPDGAIQQVRWSGGSQGFFTSASRNMEVHLPQLNHDQRLERLQARADRIRGHRERSRKKLYERRRAAKVHEP